MLENACRHLNVDLPDDKFPEVGNLMNIKAENEQGPLFNDVYQIANNNIIAATMQMFKPVR